MRRLSWYDFSDVAEDEIILIFIKKKEEAIWNKKDLEDSEFYI